MLDGVATHTFAVSLTGRLGRPVADRTESEVSHASVFRVRHSGILPVSAVLHSSREIPYLYIFFFKCFFQVLSWIMIIKEGFNLTSASATYRLIGVGWRELSKPMRERNIWERNI